MKPQPWVGLLMVLPAFAQDPVFTTSTNSVQVEAVVASGQRPIAGLRTEDFVLLDNGQPRAITGIASEELPLDIVVVCRSILVGRAAPLDNREDSIPQYRFSRAGENLSRRLMNAASNAVLGARPTDRVAIVRYGRDPRIELRFTNDRKAIAAAIKRFGNPDNADENIVLTSEGLAIEYAVRMLADVEKDDPKARTTRRRLIVLVSNVFGVGAHYASERVIRRLWDQNVILSVIDDTPATEATKNVQRSDGGESQSILFQRYNPIRIAQATGGDRIVALDGQHPSDLLTPIRQRYTLWFNQPSDAAPGESRTIQLQLSEAARRRFPDAVIKAREGYVAQ